MSRRCHKYSFKCVQFQTFRQHLSNVLSDQQFTFIHYKEQNQILELEPANMWHHCSKNTPHLKQQHPHKSKQSALTGLVLWCFTKGERPTRPSWEWASWSRSPPTTPSLKAQRASDLCLCNSTHTLHPNIYRSICVSRRALSIEYQSTQTEIWINVSLTGWRIVWYHEALKTQQQGYPLIQTQSEKHSGSRVRYTANLPAGITLTFGKVSGIPPFRWAAYHTGCPIWLGGAEQWLNIWSSTACVAVITIWEIATT